MGGEAAAKILAHARASTARVTSVDVLAPGEPGLLDWIAPALEHADYLLPNDEQVLGFTGEADVAAGCRALLERGVGCVVATLRRRRRAGVDGDGEARARRSTIDVVDTTGCGDAFTAGFLRGLSLGRDRRAAASSAAPRRRSSPRAWAPTPAPTTSPPPRRSPPERRRARSPRALRRCVQKVSEPFLRQPTPLGDCERIHSRSVSSPTRA